MPSRVSSSTGGIADPFCLLPYVIPMPRRQGTCRVRVWHPASGLAPCGGVGSWIWWGAPENRAPDAKEVLWLQAGAVAFSWISEAFLPLVGDLVLLSLPEKPWAKTLILPCISFPLRYAFLPRLTP